jgi:lycopene beta-cyclase
VKGSVRSIRNLSEHSACVQTDRELLVGRWVFQSILRPAPVTPTRSALLQHFGGWEVETEEPLFDPSTFTLMDFTVEQRGAVAFRYVLPTAPNRALVEHTIFSPERQPREAYDHELSTFLDRRTTGYRIVRTEYGAIPMRDGVLPQQSGACVFNLGTVGGMTKPTTGYTFLRIQEQVESLVQGLVTTGRPTPLPDRPRRFAWYDQLLLQILTGTPHLGRSIFSRLFQAQSTEEILTFLDERSTPLQEAKLFWSLPWAPFLQAAVRKADRKQLGLQAPRAA